MYEMYGLYEPREDSLLLSQAVKKFCRGIVLDMGTGTGIQALESAKKRSVKKIFGADINNNVIKYCKRTIINKKIIFIKSDLFSSIKRHTKEKFDTIIFNPPYLPKSGAYEDIALDGGKKGYEITVRFIEQAKNYLMPNGIILLLISSLTKPAVVKDTLKNNGFNWEQVLEERIGGFETLYVYKITKSSFVKKLESLGITGIRRFARGHRGEIFIGTKKKTKVAVKRQRENLNLNTVSREAKVLEKLNKKKIGPKLLMSGKDYFAYKFVDGLLIEEFLKQSEVPKIKNVLIKIIMQCFILDMMRLNKEEMHRPYKHIIVKNENPVMIDFERCTHAKEPKNITQLIQYVTSKRISRILKEKRINVNATKIRKSAADYKKNPNVKNLKRIIKFFGDRK